MRKKEIKEILAWTLSLLLLFLPLAACGQPGEAAAEETPPPTVDPYAGMVEVQSGFGTTMWVRKYDELPVNPLGASDFDEAGVYTGTTYTVRRGVDVSEHQGEIDWAAVAESGIEFAILRAGYRGYGAAGSLNRDAFFDQNLAGAEEQGLRLGVYFFSQAVSVAEAEEEADFLLDILSAYPVQSFALPVYYDWEAIFEDEARTDGLDGETVTACAVAFCRKLRDAGYTPGVYAYRNLAYFTYDLRQLREFNLWLGAVGSYPDFYYAHQLWQYSYQGTVPGIASEVDLDYWFTPNRAAPVHAAEAEPETVTQTES